MCRSAGRPARPGDVRCASPGRRSGARGGRHGPNALFLQWTRLPLADPVLAPPGLLSDAPEENEAAHIERRWLRFAMFGVPPIPRGGWLCGVGGGRCLGVGVARLLIGGLRTRSAEDIHRACDYED